MFKEKEKLITELRNIVVKHNRILKQEYQSYQEDLKSMNVNAKWINDALKLNLTLSKDMPNKIVMYLITKCQDRKELSL